ncbi:MAG: DUF1211 domain-containing protein [Gemmatimonadales bacterium]|nr:MAG: DUF1211 domain-containing protein [Gemmatimonadales bacterium]
MWLSGGSVSWGCRGSPEFGRIVNLCDAVFAISLTLLVLTLDGLEVSGLVSFALAFFLVGNVWWHHLRIVAQPAWFEPGLLALTLALLAGVALVPLPTSLIGEDPGASSAVLPFIGLFALLSVVSFVFILRAQRLGAWRQPLAPRLFRWILVDWGTNLAILLACLVVALRWPLAALILLVVASAVGTGVVGVLGPRERRAWF